MIQSKNKLDIDRVTTGQLLGLMLLAYIFSFVIRLIWVYQFQDNSAFFWNNQLMINTNDGYFFASGAQKELFGLHSDNPRVFGMWDYGVIFFTTLLAKITPFSLETIILYLPAIVSSLVVIPIILIARLYNEAIWGFFAALLGSIAWSYYNRTMTGYYDTDMFSAMAPMFILFFLMKSTMDFNLRSGLYASIAIAVYPFLYDAGLSIVYAMGIVYAAYMIFYHRDAKTTYMSLILIFISLLPFPLSPPLLYIFKIVVLITLYVLLKKSKLEIKKLMILCGILFILFLLFGNVISLLLAKITNYLSTGTKDEGLHFYSVVQTVREAGKIPFSVFANRISGSQIGVFVAFIGYIVLVVRHRAFILALPLMGIGIFALFGGLRFTVYAVPVAAMSAVYLFFVLGEYFFKDKKQKYLFIALATGLMIYPNIKHIVAYRVPTVLNKAEVLDLVKLDKVSKTKDYTLAWWDYGYPIWYYSDTNTIIDGGKHNNDNFIVSKILTTDSQIQAANLARLAVETYINSHYSVVANKIFDKKDPNEFLNLLKNRDFKLPSKTRDVYIYLPYKMLNIFPTVAIFSNLDLATGQQFQRPFFYLSRYFQDKGKILDLGNGIMLDKSKSILNLGSQKVLLRRFVTVGYDKNKKFHKEIQNISEEGPLSLIYMPAYETFLLVDEKMYNSLYIKMFVLQEYDKDLFEPVVISPYSKIYRLKI